MNSKEKDLQQQIERKKWLIEIMRGQRDDPNRAKTEFKDPGGQENDGWLCTGVWKRNRTRGV